MIIGIVVLEVILIIALVGYNIHTNNNLKLVKKSKKKMNKLYIMKEIIEITSNSTSVNDKLAKINTLLLNKLNVEYSTVIHFNGINYSIKTTNVPKQDEDEILKMQLLDVYKNTIQNDDIKYLTVEENIPNLIYTKINSRNAKSSIFLPLLKDKMYLGYWVIESSQVNAFDKIDVEILYILKNAILDTILTLGYESALENMVRDDKYSNLKSFEYMLTEGKNILDKSVISQLVMFRIANLEEINEKFTRQAGNIVIEQIGRTIEEKFKKEIPDLIAVRYIGPKFLIAIPANQKHQVEEKLKLFKQILENIEIIKTETGFIIDEIKEETEEEIKEETLKVEIETKTETEIETKTEIETENNTQDSEDIKDAIDEILEEDEKEKNKKERYNIKINIAVTSYYKNTSLDVIAKKLEQYVDANLEQLEITYI